MPYFLENSRRATDMASFAKPKNELFSMRILYLYHLLRKKSKSSYFVDTVSDLVRLATNGSLVPR